MSDKTTSPIPGIYLATAYRSLASLKDARTTDDAQVLILGSISNSLSGLLALGIEKAYGQEALIQAIQDVAEE